MRVLAGGAWAPAIDKAERELTELQIYWGSIGKKTTKCHLTSPPSTGVAPLPAFDVARGLCNQLLIKVAFLKLKDTFTTLKSASARACLLFRLFYDFIYNALVFF